MSGIKAQTAVTAGTETTLYTVPDGYLGVYKITIRNTTDVEATVKIWYTATTTSEEKKEWEERFQRSFSVSGEVLDAGQNIIIETSRDAVATVKGIEEAV